MNYTQLLFGFKGRIQRLYWWITSLVVAAAAGMLTQSLEFWAQQIGSGAVDPDTSVFEPSGWFGVGVGLIAILNMWINLAVGAKRLHDRDRSFWWLVWQTLVLFLAIVLAVVAVLMPEEQRTTWFVLAGLVGMVAVGLGIWLLVEMGFLRGTQGPNRFGPDPLGAPQSDAKL